MPAFSASGYGPYSSFIPAASDAYAALLQRMPVYAEEKFQRAKRKDDLDVQDRNEQRAERKKRLGMEASAMKDAKAERERGRKDASAAAYSERQDALGERLQQSEQAQSKARRYGGDPFQAGRVARNDFDTTRRASRR